MKRTTASPHRRRNNPLLLLFATPDAKRPARLTYVNVDPPAHRTPADLRQLATNCRHMAARSLTEIARRPLYEVADELELEAYKQQQLRHELIWSGRR